MKSLFSICSEVLTTVGYPAASPRIVHPQLFLPMPRSSSPLYKVAVGASTHLLPSVNIIPITFKIYAKKEEKKIMSVYLSMCIRVGIMYL